MSKRGDSRAAGKVRRSNSLCLSLGGVCEVVARGKSSLSKLGKRTGKAVAADESSISTIDSAQKEVGTPAVVGEELCLVSKTIFQAAVLENHSGDHKTMAHYL